MCGYLKRILALSLLQLLISCMNDKSYVYYLLDPEIQTDPELTENSEKKLKPLLTGSDQVMRVQWNDGKMYTEVSLPLLTSGQRIIIDHGAKTSYTGTTKNTPTAITSAPGANDVAHKTLLNAYLGKGLKENQKAPNVSLAQVREDMKQALNSGNYVLALSHVENTLNRYPEHPEFLRAKGSILLMMGEKQKAIEVYESAQDVEYDPAVARKLLSLRK